MSRIDANSLLDVLQSHALASGYFERVNRHEPKNAPGNGVTAALWVQRIDPVAFRSGLAATSARIEFTMRVFSSMTSEPQDEIDPNVVAAATHFMGELSGDFELGSTDGDVDLLGAHGAGLGIRAGYVNVSGTMYRVMDVTVPIILNDVWTQVA